MDVNQTWLELVSHVLHHGLPRSPRGQATLELLGHQTVVWMNSPVLTVARRRLGRKFLAAEAAWILSGDNRVSSIVPYARQLTQFSDDGLTFNGAYGPKFVDQVAYVVRCLIADSETRQAVMTLWRERPGLSLDHPCTVALQFMRRDDQLHCMVTMRSSDIWLGIPYDWHTFSMMSAYVLLSCRNLHHAVWKDVTLGRLYVTAGSQHLYEKDRAVAEACLKDPSPDVPYSPYSLTQLENPDALVAELWRRARGPT